MLNIELTSEIERMIREKPPWLSLLAKDPRKKLLNSNESFTTYRTLTDLFDFPLENPVVQNAHKKLLQDSLAQHLISNLSDWEKDLVKGHDHPQYLPNQLWLLQDWGIKFDDSKEVQSEIEKIISHFDHEQSYLAKHRAFLPIKVKALEKIDELSEKKSYSSYHYVPDIYDYSYQYLYFQKAFKGKKLPYEFSYQPGETKYIKEKA